MELKGVSPPATGEDSCTSNILTHSNNCLSATAEKSAMFSFCDHASSKQNGVYKNKMAFINFYNVRAFLL